MITTKSKKDIVHKFGSAFGKGESDTGSAAVQVALLTERINGLKGHFGRHIHDYHSNRGLLKMIGQRRSLLKYVQKKSTDSYKKLIGELGLRK